MALAVHVLGFSVAAGCLIMAAGVVMIDRAIARSARRTWEERHPGMSWDDWQAMRKAMRKGGGQ
jgi:hypothetical protein